MVMKLLSISTATLRQMISEAKAKIEIVNDTDFPTVRIDGSIAFNAGPTVFNAGPTVFNDGSTVSNNGSTVSNDGSTVCNDVTTVCNVVLVISFDESPLQ